MANGDAGTQQGMRKTDIVARIIPQNACLIIERRRHLSTIAVAHHSPGGWPSLGREGVARDHHVGLGGYCCGSAVSATPLVYQSLRMSN